MPCLENGIHYHDTGSGPPILLVHGWCMSSAIWGLQSALSATHRLLAIDLRGHGRSTGAGAGVKGFGAYGDDIVTLVEQLDLRGITLVGWSMGAQALLKAYPRLKGRITALVLVGATPRFTAAPHFPWGLQRDEAAGMALKVRRNLERALEGFRKRMFAEGELDDPAVARQVEALLAQVVLPSSLAALDGLEALMEEELIEEARLVDCPTLIVHGDQDLICRPEASRWLESVISGSVRYCFEGCGHAPFLSRADRFNRLLLQFVGASDATF